ncbi:MAG: hypothetical protein E3J60_02715 [Dehalococcoidia bacterium]|nr:MAG: hypothetical protein E3J60_02715 [Dehalococcoidia bacterium]
MASNDSDRIGFLSAGGILSIVAGAFEVNGGGIMLASAKLGVQFRLWDFALYPGIWFEHIIPVDSPWFIIMGGLLVVLGIIAILGGIWALRRRSFGLSLAGAVCVLPLGILGIVAIVCIALAKREFEVGD